MKLDKENIKIAVIGLGYVGLPLAVEFSKKFPVIGFDLNVRRINELKQGYDHTNEITEDAFKTTNLIDFVSSEEFIADSNIYIITVPTPVDVNNVPDLKYIISASEIVAKYIEDGNIVIYESTVYPGCTEEVCVPVLEKVSGKVFNSDFFCGYSPERINPGDKKHTLTKIKKITSGSNKESSELIDNLYNQIITAGTFRTSSIKIAEAAKVIENTQRDVNIALVNELSLIFDKLDIDTLEVLEAAETKWNFLPFRPGLVGGHCIGVDPYYLTHKAMEVGYHPQMILSGRRINDTIGAFIADKTISELTKNQISPLGASITILGLTFKENCPDLRNTKVLTIIDQLKKYECKIDVSDDWADKIDTEEKLGLSLEKLSSIRNQDAVIIAVGHNNYKKLTVAHWKKMLKPSGIIIDVKSILNKRIVDQLNIPYWRL